MSTRVIGRINSNPPGYLIVGAAGGVAGLDDTAKVPVDQLPEIPGSDPSALHEANNLSDVADAATARTNLGLGTAATHPAGDFATPADITALSSVYASQSAAFLSALGGRLTFFEDFTRRADGDLAQYVDGLSATSGQGYGADGLTATNSKAVIVSGTQRWSDETSHGATPIRILGSILEQVPDSYGAQFVLTAGTGTTGHNAVPGLCQVSYGTSSVQLATYLDHWILFMSGPDGIAGAYALTTLASGTFATPLTPLTPYSVFLRRDPTTSTIKAELADGTSVSVVNALASSRWGARVCAQERRDTASTDGNVRYLRLAASVTAPALTGLPGAGMVIATADKGNYVDCQQPAGFKLRQIEFFGSPGTTWATAAAQALASIWTSDTANQSWSFAHDTAGRPGIYFSSTGTGAAGSLIGPTSAIPAGISALRLTYDPATGNVMVYTSTDPTAVNNPAGVTWTQLGTTHTTSGGEPFAASALTRLRIGTRDFNTAFLYSGTIQRFLAYDGIGGNPVADCDLRVPWQGSRWTDPYGNTWQAHGTYSWAQPSQLPAYGTLAARPAVGTVTDGAVYVATDTNGGTAYQAQAGAWVQIAGAVSPPGGKVLAVLGSGTAVTNTTTETTTHTLPTIPAGSLVAQSGTTGTVQEFDIGATVCNAAGSGFSGHFRDNVSNASILSFSWSATITGAHATPIPVRFSGKIYVITTGASGAVWIRGRIDQVSASGALTAVLVDTQVTGVDLSAGLKLKATVTESAADVLNIFQPTPSIFTQPS